MKKSELLRYAQLLELHVKELERRIETLEKERQPLVVRGVPYEPPTSPSVAPWYPPLIVTC